MARIVNKGITTILLDTDDLRLILAQNVEDYYINVGTDSDYFIRDLGDIKNVRIVADEIEIDIESD